MDTNTTRNVVHSTTERVISESKLRPEEITLELRRTINDAVMKGMMLGRVANIDPSPLSRRLDTIRVNAFTAIGKLLVFAAVLVVVGGICYDYNEIKIAIGLWIIGTFSVGLCLSIFSLYLEGVYDTEGKKKDDPPLIFHL